MDWDARVRSPMVHAPTRLLLIRHAHIDSRARLCGALDVPLSARGEAQLCELMTRTPRHPPPAALYTSPLGRARQVAAALAGIWNLPPRGCAAIGEIDCGMLEGEPFETLVREHRDLWARNTAQQDDDFTWPGGESYRAFRQRLLGGLREIAAAHPGARVAIVTHAGVISQVLGTMRGRRPAVWEHDRPDPLTGTEVMWANGTPEALVAFNRADWL